MREDNEKMRFCGTEPNGSFLQGIIPVLLGLLLLASPARVQAQFSYTVNTNGTATITGYSGTNGAVIIPSNTNGWRITSIGTNAFSMCVIMTSVTIPNSVTNIGDYAFCWCRALTSVAIPNTVISIGDGAFQECSGLTNVTIPASVTSIGDSAFAECANLPSVTIPGSVTAIGQLAFELCTNLGCVTIGNGVTSIGFAAFVACYSLTNVTIPASVTFVGNAVFEQCNSLTGVYFMGNAPAFISSGFPGCGATLYYLPGATGWSSTSAVLWNPVIQTGDGGFGLTNNQFGFNIAGTNNITVVVEACTNLASPAWLPLKTVTLTNGLFHFSEPAQSNTTGRFYGLGLP
jgi:hypothetical protein